MSRASLTDPRQPGPIPAGRAGSPAGLSAAPAPRHARAVLGVATATHFVHDGFSDLLYLLFPLWAGALGLSFSQVGVLKMAFSGGMAGFQVPAGLLAERWGERRLLAAGTAVTAGAFLLAGAAGTFPVLLLALAVAGLGSAVQHPLASSLVARAYETGRRRLALGTYNFAGDVGKTAVPAAVALALPWLGPAGATWAYGAVGLLAALGILVVLGRLGAGAPGPQAPRPAGAGAGGAGGAGWGIRDVRAYLALAAIHVIDNGTRAAFFTFLPFLLVARGGTAATVGLALALLFAGGALGKLACGALAERLGVLPTVVATEAATAAGILAVLALPLPAALALLPPLGAVTNGTSSVLYGSVADVVEPGRHGRAYAVFYTVGVTASAAAPLAWGVVTDLAGLATTLAAVAATVLLAVPLAVAVRGSLAVTPAGTGGSGWTG